MASDLFRRTSLNNRRRRPVYDEAVAQGLVWPCHTNSLGTSNATATTQRKASPTSAVKTNRVNRGQGSYGRIDWRTGTVFARSCFC